MALLKKLFVTVLVLVALFLGIGFFLPSDFKVERQIVINAPASDVYAHIVDLKKWRQWGIWYQRDPDMQVNYQGAESGKGMKSVWVSELEGNGEMTIIAADQNHRLIYTLSFADIGVGSTGEMTLSEENGKTTLVWQDYGDVGMNPLNHYFVLMMDSMIGPDFEKSLQKLKTVTENQ